MLQKIKKLLKQYNFSRENYGIIVVCIFGLWVAWNSLAVINKNNRLIEDIDTRSEETALLELENENLALGIEYYKTDEFIEKAARRDLLLHAPEENVAISPKTKNAEFNPPSLQQNQPEVDQTNIQKWFNFFTGRKQ